ncbi:MAG: biotin--[Firmicutes bacterium]|nr:biotin--[acetyl-CoA-carboxylase] ligase [Bacillota bacterium]
MAENWRTDRFIHQDVTGSTNEDMKKLDERGLLGPGSVITSRAQSAGRGQYDRKFASPEGGLYYSYLMIIEEYGDEVLEITLMVGVALRHAVYRTTGLLTDIKWLNDLYYEGRKLAGILAESRIVSPTEMHTVIGIGINVNTEMSQLPEELRSRAVSLKEILGAETDIQRLITALTDELDLLCEALSRGETEDYIDEFRVCCFDLPEGEGLVRL